jgi:hypothetical protein
MTKKSNKEKEKNISGVTAAELIKRGEMEQYGWLSDSKEELKNVWTGSCTEGGVYSEKIEKNKK